MMTGSGTGPKVLSASTMMKDNVQNAQGEDIGSIKEFMIDLSNGCIAYAVLSFGGFLGIGDKLFAIPWQALRLDTTTHNFILDVSREKLENAPGFDKDNWPDMADETWSTGVHDYYGTKPEWKSDEAA